LKTIGVDLGGTNLRVALVDTAGEKPRLDQERKIALEDTRPERVADAIGQAVREVEDEAGAAAAIGVGLAGMLRGGTGIVENAPNLGWRDVDFGGLLAARVPGRKVVLANDVNAITWGEHRYGAGMGAADVLCIFAGTGIGGGLVAGGRLVEGTTGIAGEIGHTKVVVGPTARACGCGQRGCIEAYAGGRLLSERARAELRVGGRSLAVELAGGDPEAVHPGHLDAAAAEGDPYAVALWDEIAPLFGLVIANAVTLLNPARVIVGGGVLWGAAELRRRALDAYDTLVNAEAGKVCRIVEAALGDAAGILGAAAIAAGDLSSTAP
jgi:glucokinase